MKHQFDLKKVLNDDKGEKTFQSIELISLGDYESDAHYIKAEINKALETIPGEIVGLNYTGGTKAMSVHAYRTLFYEEAKENNESKDKKYKRRSNIIFSYLDARRLEICIDRENEEREHIKIEPSTIEIELVKLFNLHGLNLNNTPEKQAKLPNLAKALAYLFSDEVKRKLWCSGFYKEFCEQARKKKQDGSLGDWKSQNLLMEISISMEGLPQEIVCSI